MYTNNLKTITSSTDFSIAEISHEIGNPLTLIYSTIQILSDKYPELGHDLLWQQLQDDINYLKDLNISLSKYSHSADLNIKKLSVQTLFEDIKAYWYAFVQKSNRHLTFDLPENISTIECDYIKIKECLINLIKNSIEATKNNDSIHISAEQVQNYIHIKVSDSGSGIPKSQLEDIFKPFTTYKTGGKGLGLTITKRIILAHHGTIDVQSSNLGTTFTITLPIHQNSDMIMSNSTSAKVI